MPSLMHRQERAKVRTGALLDLVQIQRHGKVLHDGIRTAQPLHLQLRRIGSHSYLQRLPRLRALL